MQVIESNNFKRKFSKLDKNISIKIEKALTKIIEDPDIGKPMRYNRKGTREVYISPFRLSYSYDKEQNIIYLLDIYHKDKQ